MKAYYRLMEAQWLLYTIPSEPNVRQAIEFARQVVEDDPNYARGFALLADVHAIAHGIQYGIPNALVESQRFARRALELDASEWSPHIVLAEFNRERGSWDEAAANYAGGVRLGRNAPDGVCAPVDGTVAQCGLSEVGIR